MVWKETTLQMMLRGGLRVQSGRVTVCVYMSPPKCGKCAGTPHWSMGCHGLTNQDAFEYAGTMRVSGWRACGGGGRVHVGGLWAVPLTTTNRFSSHCAGVPSTGMVMRLWHSCFALTKSSG